MSTEENKAVVRRAWEGVDRGDLTVVGEVYTADCVIHEPDEDLEGVEAAKEFIGMVLEAFPGMGLTVEDMVAEGDMVAARWTARGVHRGELAGIPPSGNEVSVSGITIHRIEGGRIAEEWEMPDNLGLMSQIGAVPASEGAGA
jgi:steroid delta-isomerase-like uncharacterized protein